MLLLLAALESRVRLVDSPTGAIVRQAACGADERQATARPARSGLRVLAEARYLRNLAALVLFGTIAATFVDQAFKTQVKARVWKRPEPR